MKATTTLKRKWKPSLLILVGATALAAWAIPTNQASAYWHDGYHHHGYYYHHHHGYWHQRDDGARIWINL